MGSSGSHAPAWEPASWTLCVPAISELRRFLLPTRSVEEDIPTRERGNENQALSWLQVIAISTVMSLALLADGLFPRADGVVFVDLLAGFGSELKAKIAVRCAFHDRLGAVEVNRGVEPLRKREVALTR